MFLPFLLLVMFCIHNYDNKIICKSYLLAKCVVS